MEETTTVDDPHALKERLAGHIDDHGTIEVSRADVETHGVKVSSPSQLSVDEEEVRLLVDPTGQALPVDIGDEITVRST